MKQELKRAPCGVSSFESLRSQDYIYVDKTHFISILEKIGAPYQFIIRPRRFGKSVFSEMLMAYYDKSAKNEFNKYFSGTWIGEHPTPLANKYLVLEFDFSGIDVEQGLLNGFFSCIKAGLTKFKRRYLPDNSDVEKILEAPYTEPENLLRDFLNSIPEFEEKIYLIIDEYDQFAGEILAKDPDKFRLITSRSGFLKVFYSVIKRFTKNIIDRIFITGVTSVSLDSVTSGFNIATNISHYSSIVGAMGFTADDVRYIIPQVVDIERYGHSIDEIYNRMKVLYNGYRFSSKSDETVFNPSMCLYYLNALAIENSEPDNLIDPNASIDLTKIEGMLSLGRREFIDDVVQTILLGKYVEIGDFSEFINLNASDRLSDDDVLTILVFLGFLTFSAGDRNHLVCPNVAVKEAFFKYWFKKIVDKKNLSFPSQKLEGVLRKLEAGNVEPLLTFVSDRLTMSVGTHAHAYLSEAVIQFAVCMAINTAWNYKATVEEEALGAGFTDLILRPNENRSDAASWVIEFKYIKQSDAKQEAIDAKLAEAQAQLERYSKAENIASIPNLHRAAVVFSGTELKGLKVL